MHAAADLASKNAHEPARVRDDASKLCDTIEALADYMVRRRHSPWLLTDHA